ncbi:hypothetical protein PHLCEN_2v7017 [Hermanssonia centrifuga]|uniref:Cupin type-2 domain-containing protein n=1 Tax=Hermanssonia centrifuga TaxID=98765 RepID=A0A2R6NXR6_9APHY|nr:hypothetical protein PHLCEN_2v7017 [Hermanssonia centrifuga]
MAFDKAELTPLLSLRVSTHQIPRYGHFPNTTIHNRPLIIYHNAFESVTSASQIESHLKNVGVCIPDWRSTMYEKSHFHSTTHEFLVVASGKARLLFGGEQNPKAAGIDVQAGDAMLVPAGVAHRLLEGSEDFEMVGSYPAEAEKWDMRYGGEVGTESRIAALRWFTEDPLYGMNGPVTNF